MYQNSADLKKPNHPQGWDGKPRGLNDSRVGAEAICRQAFQSWGSRQIKILGRGGIVKYLLVFAVLLSIFCGINSGYATTVGVNGKSGPWNWNSNLNTSYSYGVFLNGQDNYNLPPTVIDSSSGLAMTPGDTLTIKWLSGDVCGGANGGAWTNGANGNPGWGVYSSPSNAPGTPAYYVPSDQFPVYFMQLMGVFANSAGAIVGDPFMIGNGPLTVSIPNGSSQLQMGFVDGWYNDNFATLQVSVTEAAPAVPAPATLLLLGPGLIGLAAVRRRFKK
jgi:hypothetical protein